MAWIVVVNKTQTIMNMPTSISVLQHTRTTQSMQST